jgi:hypothetical protein
MISNPSPKDASAQVFRAAMSDYASVMQAQTALAAGTAETVTAAWIAGVAGALGAVDDLRADMPRLPPEALVPRIDRALGDIAGRLTALMGEVQRQDALRQMLGSLSEMADGLRHLDLGQLTETPEGAAAPRAILAQIAEAYVTQDQRAAFAKALGLAHAPDRSSPEVELF